MINFMPAIPGLFISPINIVFIAVLMNNAVYQTAFAFNQVLFVLFVFAGLFVSVVGYGRIGIGVLVSMFVLLIAVMVELTGSKHISSINILFFNVVLLANYTLVYFSNARIDVDRLLFLQVLIYAVGIVLVLLNDRIIINPNWYSLSMFYMLGLSKYRTHKWPYVFLLFLSLFLFESRGTTISIAIALMVLFAFSFKVNVLRMATIFAFVLAMFLSFYLLHQYHLNQDYFYELIVSKTERGIGGRDVALLNGYALLLGSDAWAYGFAMSGQIGGEFAGELLRPVQIHFGLLDLGLRFSIIILFLFVLFIIKVIKMTPKSYLPVLSGALFTTFYYNGFGLSHAGLNLLLFLVLGEVRKAAYFSR